MDLPETPSAPNLTAETILKDATYVKEDLPCSHEKSPNVASIPKDNEEKPLDVASNVGTADEEKLDSSSKNPSSSTDKGASVAEDRELYERDRLAENPVWAVLVEHEDFLIINKPQDVRIDGDHPITVQKYVAEQHPRYSVNGKHLRFIHQLDFATSGILCLGFTRRMTGTFAKCFEDRTTEKLYLAIVYGWPEKAKVQPPACSVWHL